MAAGTATSWKGVTRNFEKQEDHDGNEHTRNQKRTLNFAQRRRFARR
jgi:hypothetical protein